MLQPNNVKAHAQSFNFNFHIASLCEFPFFTCIFFLVLSFLSQGEIALITFTIQTVTLRAQYPWLFMNCVRGHKILV